MINTPILIIGAGPAGLAIAGQLRHRNIPFTIIEKSDKIGFAWHNHYDRLHLHTVKQFSHLPFFPFPEHYPTYVPRQQLVDYYENYAHHFKIKPIFNQEIIQVKKENNQWISKTVTGETYVSHNVVLATGINRIPHQPIWKGLGDYKGTLMHSKYYKNGKPFHQQKVLVVGMGNTGAEIALDLYEHGAQPFISIRGPINIVPRDVNGTPTQVTAKRLAKLPNVIKDWLGIQIAKMTIGDLSKYGIKRPKIAPAKQLTLYGKTPVIDVGTVAEIKKGNINILPDIDYFHRTGVAFKNGQEHNFDAIILATGYLANVEHIVNGAEAILDEFNLPAEIIQSGELEGLYFLGFDNYKLGGILGIIYDDSEKIAEHIDSKMK